MSLAVSPIHNISYSQKPQVFTASAKDKNQNPISKTGERANLIKATFVGGLALGVRLLAEVWDFDFLFNHIEKKSSKMVRNDAKKMSANKRMLIGLGAAAGLIAAAVTGFALLYTALNAPKIAYKGKVNAFTKGKDMDVYIKGNEAEKELFTQIADKARNADDSQKEELAKQYLQMKAAKNRLPDFIKG